MNKTIKKIIPYILILIIFVGFFGLTTNATAFSGVQRGPATTPPKEEPDTSEFAKMLTDDCGVTSGPKVMGCVLVVLYYTYFQVPALILALSASFFNSIASISLDSTLTASSKFIPEAWVVVRDLSNIFFILVLLYISIQTILGIGGHDGPKKMVAQVIIMALLINFSMFFTKIVIDSANILALVFFEKINVESRVAGEKKPREYEQSRPGEKDISGGIVQAFNPTKLVSKEFLDKTKVQKTFAGDVVSKTVPFSIKLGMIIVSGTIMLFAAYAFFIAGISFLGRLIELWILIIFSPFAFMSSIIPILSHIEGIGWESWLKKLLSTSFMAPIFMFFIYLIFKLLKTNIFGSFVSGKGFMANFLGILLPALILLALLLKATEFAKKGGGKFGEMALGAIKVAGGLALGAATGGAALLGTGLIGGAANKFMSSGLGAKLRNREKEGGIGGFASRMALRTANYGTKASFDVRKVAGVGALAKMGGIDLEAAKGIGLGTREGGYMQRRADKEKKRQERANELKLREDDPLKQKANQAEAAHQELLAKRGNAHEIETLGNKIKGMESQASADSRVLNADRENPLKIAKAQASADELVRLKKERSDLKKGKGVTDPKTGVTTYNTTNGKITEKEVEQAVEDESLAQANKVAADTLATTATAEHTAAEGLKNIADATAAASTAAAATATAMALFNPSAANTAAATAAAATATADTAAAATAANNVTTALANMNTAVTKASEAATAETTATTVANRARTAAVGGTGRSINDLEDKDIPDAHAAIESENKSRQHAEARRISKKTFWGKTNKAAAHKIMMDAKLDSGHGGKESH